MTRYKRWLALAAVPVAALAIGACGSGGSASGGSASGPPATDHPICEYGQPGCAAPQDPTAAPAPTGPTSYQLQEAYNQGQFAGEHNGLGSWECNGEASSYGSGPYRAELQAQFRDGCFSA